MLGKNLSHASATTRFAGMQLQQALAGTVVPVLFGTRRMVLDLIWYGDFNSKKAKQQGGKGGGSGGGLGKGGGGASYVYSASILGLLSEGVVNGIDSVWDQDGMYVVEAVTENFNIPGGSGVVNIQNGGAGVYNNDYGVGHLQAFSMVKNDFGDPNGPTTISGTQVVPFTRVSGSPGVGQYTIDGAGAYTFNAADAGKPIQITYTFFRYLLEERELAAVPIDSSHIVIVQHQPDFRDDKGVVYFPSGVALTRVGLITAPTGQYTEAGGHYQFGSGEGGSSIIISYTWKNPQVDQNAPASLNMTLINGTPGQAPWAFLSSNHPSQADSYTGCALVGSSSLFLGYIPNLPNYSFEVGAPFAHGAGVQDVCPADAIQAILNHPIFGVGVEEKWIDGSLQGLARSYWLANNFFISDYLNTQSTAASVIGKYLESSMVAAFWSEGKIKFVPAGDQTAVANGATYIPPTHPIVSFNDSDYIVEKGKDPVTMDRTPWQDAFNEVKVEYSVRANSYNRDIMTAQDEGSIDMVGHRPEGPKSYQFICLASVAQYAANLRLQRFQGVRSTYQTTVKSIYSFLEPMDVIEIKDPALIGVNAVKAVRITKITDDPAKGIDITAEDLPFSVFSTVLYTKETGTPSDDPSLSKSSPDKTALVVVEIPAQVAFQKGNNLYIFATPEGTNWGGCDIFYSFDNVIYNYLDTIKIPGRVGFLTAPLASGFDPDTVNSFTMKLKGPDASLLTVPQEAADALVTLSALVDSDGHLELIAYENADLVGPSTYTFSYLRRGAYGTTIRSFPAGNTLFVRMDEASLDYQYPNAFMGKTIFFKACSFNQYGLQEQSLADVEPLAVRLGGVPAAFDAGEFGPAPPAPPVDVVLSNTVTADFAMNATPAVVVNVHAGVITLSGGGPPINVPDQVLVFTTWNSVPVAFPAVPATGSDYKHYGGNVVWDKVGAAIVVQQYGPLDNVTPANPWTVTQGALASAVGLIPIAVQLDGYLVASHTGTGGGGGGGGGLGGGGGDGGGGGGGGCPIVGTAIQSLGGAVYWTVFDNDEWVKLTLVDGKSITATPEHPIYTDRGKTRLKDVRLDDMVVTVDGSVMAKSKETPKLRSKAMNVKVPRGNLYWANGILSHNFKIVLEQL